MGRSGLMVSRIGLGTLTWGRDTDADDAARQLKFFCDAGGTLVDTADSYSDGDSERILGRLLAPRGAGVPRASLVLASKAGSPTGESPGRAGCSRRHLLAALDASLDRLGTTYLDLWQVACWDPATPLEETLAALDIAVGSGRARYVGVCNYTGWQAAKAATWQGAWPGRTPLVSTQVEYSLLDRAVEREAVPAAVDAGLGVLPWSPLGRGVLTGKYRRATPADSRGASTAYRAFLALYLDERCARIVEAVCTAADGLSAAPLAVALAWVCDAPGVVAPLVGARTWVQLRAAVEAEQLRLPAEIRRALDDVSGQPASNPEVNARSNPERIG